MSKDDHHQQVDLPISQERLRRRPSYCKPVYVRPVSKARTAVIALLVIISLGILTYYKMFYSARFVVTLNDKPLVALTTRKESEQAILRLKQQYAPNVPQVVYFDQGELQVQPLRHHMRVLSVNQAVDTLKRHVTVEMRGTGIFVNGEPTVMVASAFDALQVIELSQEHAASGRTGIPTFKQRVVIAPYRQRTNDDYVVPIMTPRQAAKELSHPPRPQYYTVESGDCFYSIAMAHGLTVNQIKALNPKTDPRTLQPGDKVRLPDVLAPLTVVMRR